LRAAGLLQTAAAAAVYVLLGWVASRSEIWAAIERSLPLLIAGAIIATGLFLALALFAIAGIVRAELKPWQQILGLVLCAAVGVSGRKLHAPMAADIALILGAGLFGALLSRIIREKDLLLPVALTAVIVDTWGVYWGFVADLSKSAPKVVSNFSASVPVAAKSMVPIPMLGSVGIGDFLFIGLFLAVVWRLQLEWRRTIEYILIAMLLGPIVLLGVPALLHFNLQALPGLPLIVVAVVIACRRHLPMTRTTAFALLYTALVTCGILGAYVAGRAILG
jgi:hypothetical protein